MFYVQLANTNSYRSLNNNIYSNNTSAVDPVFALVKRAYSKQTMPPVDKAPVEKYVEDLIEHNRIVIFSKTTCPWCVKVKELFKSLNEEFISIEIDVIGK